MRSTWLLAAALALGGVGTALALPGGGAGAGSAGAVPSQQEVEKRVKEYLDGTTAAEAEWEKVKIAYRRVPADPMEVARSIGTQGNPGKRTDAAVKQILPLARPCIDRYLGQLGTLVAGVDLTVKGKKLAAGEYVFGLLVDGEMQPVAIALSGAALRAPLKLPLKAAAAKEPSPSLSIAIREGKASGEFAIEVSLGKVVATSGKLDAAKP